MGSQNPYFQSIVATWIARYACGVSEKHLKFSDSVPKQITSLMRFHIYFTYTQFTRKFETIYKTQIDSLLRKYNTGFVEDHYPKWTWQQLLHTEDPNHGVTKEVDYRLQNHPGSGPVQDIQNDHKFISETSFTRNRLELIKLKV